MPTTAPDATLQVVVGIAVDDVGRLLVNQRPTGKDYAGQWEFPGGKIEHGESPFEALKREWHEEMGVIVTEARHLFAFGHRRQVRQIELDVWAVTSFVGHPRGREGQAIRWADPAALQALNFLDGNQELLRRLSVNAELTCGQREATRIDLSRR